MPISMGMGTCVYCGEYGRMTRDHVIPRAIRKTVQRYGAVSPDIDRYYTGDPPMWDKDGLASTVPACAACNNKRGIRPYAEFKEWLGTDVGKNWLKNRATGRVFSVPKGQRTDA